MLIWKTITTTHLYVSTKEGIDVYWILLQKKLLLIWYSVQQKKAFTTHQLTS